MPIQGRINGVYSKFEFLIETELEQIRRYVIGQDELIKQAQKRIEELISGEIWPDKTHADNGNRNDYPTKSLYTESVL